MREEISDRDFAEQALRRLPEPGPSSGFEVALMAAYDAWNAERAKGPWAAFKAGLRRFSETVWPGAPVWVPASVLVAAMLVGAGLGTALPEVAPAEQQPGFSLEQPANFSLLASDTTEEENL